jgi:hypothetical protein
MYRIAPPNAATKRNPRCRPGIKEFRRWRDASPSARVATVADQAFRGAIGVHWFPAVFVNADPAFVPSLFELVAS